VLQELEAPFKGTLRSKLSDLEVIQEHGCST